MTKHRATSVTPVLDYIMLQAHDIITTTPRQQFLYWNGEKQSYLPTQVSSEDSSASKEEGKKVKKNDIQDKVKVAKKIAKDME